MNEETVVVADHHSWLSKWDGPIMSFEAISPDILARYRTAVLAPGDAKYQRSCEDIFAWKRSGQLDKTRLFLSTYKGRHLWSPENDALVERWAVHARSEREVLNSERLYFIPLCVMPPRQVLTSGDDGYVFVGGRKWRRLDVGIEAMSRSGLPSRVISDFAPEGDFPNVDISREKIPKRDYIDVMARARVVLVPLLGTPVSHGHVDVVTAISIGKPVVVTGGASCDDYVQHGVNGLLVEGNSVEAWTAAIREAYDRADAFAAAAREMAPRYDSALYCAYVREMIEYPDRYRVRPEAGIADPRWDRTEWHDSIERVAHQRAMRSATQALREGRFADALAEVKLCLDGPFRTSAIRVKVTALMRTDSAAAEAVLRELISAGSADAEAHTNLASVLWTQRRPQEALLEARKGFALDPDRVKSRARLIAILLNLRQMEEAKMLLEDGLAMEPNNKELINLQKEMNKYLDS